MPVGFFDSSKHLKRYNVPLKDGYERVSVCSATRGHRHSLVNAWAVDPDLVSAADGWEWPSYCVLCHINKQPAADVARRLSEAGALELL
jgi:hypothetical protein